ncbi:hypothetical protein R6Q59_006172 [Mikania micrantha]
MTHTTFFKALKKIRAFCFIIWGGPSLDRILHGNLINKDFVKIQVDIIIEGYEKMPVIDVTRTDEIMFVGDMLHQFIQWPRHALKLVNSEAMSTSSSSQRGTTRNVSSPCSSYRVDSPQTHNNDSSSSPYRPLQDEDFNSIAPQVPSEYELGPMGFMNLLTRMEQIEPQNLYTPELPSINAPDPEPKFIDPEINISLKKIKKRPILIRSIVEVLSTYVGDEYAITYSSPNGMYDKTYDQGVSYGELLHLFCNEWLDISVVHLFTMYFYELSNSKCAFLNPHDIAGDVCIKNPNHAKDHILEMYLFHGDKTFFVAPYIASGHWLVFIIYPLKRQGYIIDSINNHKGKENYAFSFIVEEALSVKLNWELVKIWNEMKFFTQKDIDQMILQLVPQVVDNLFPN